MWLEAFLVCVDCTLLPDEVSVTSIHTDLDFAIEGYQAEELDPQSMRFLAQLGMVRFAFAVGFQIR